MFLSTKFGLSINLEVVAIIVFVFFNIYLFIYAFLGLHPWHMEVPRLGTNQSCSCLAYATATATATWDPSHVCKLHHGSRQFWILNPLSKARDRTHIFMDTCQVLCHWATTGNPHHGFYFILFYLLFRAALAAYGDSQARVPIGATVASLHHSHSNTISKPHLQPTPQPTATPNP